MRDYGKISTSIWQSRKFRGLPHDDGRLLYLYLHTCQHVNSVGCYVLPDGYALHDLKWSEERYAKAMDSLSEAYLVAFDRGESLVRLIDYLKYDPFTNPKHAEGAIKIARKLPNSPEKRKLFDEIAGMRHVKSDVSGDTTDSLSKGYRNPEPEPEPQIVGVGGGAVAEIEPKSGDLLMEVLAAVGHKSGRIPAYWMPPAATLHVQRWVTDLNLTPEQVLEAARMSRQNHPEPPNGPKALDRVMKLYAEQLAAPPLEPTPPQANRKPANDRQARERAFNDSQRELVKQLRNGETHLDTDASNPFAPRYSGSS